MKIIFFGTPEYVVCVPDKLLKHFRTNSNQHPITAVITQPPRPSGRDKRLAYSPIDEWAFGKNIAKYFDPNDILKEGIFADIGVLASYGEIISDEVISHFRYGILNIHPSLLPSWRGASPVPASIISGETNTGVSIIKLDSKMDHGPIVSQFIDEVQDSDTTGSLRKRVFERSSDVMPTLIDAYIAGKIKPKIQDEEKVTFARQIKKEEAFILPGYIATSIKGKCKREKWEIPFMKITNSKKMHLDSDKKTYTMSPTAGNLSNFIRAMDPWPIAWSNIKIKSQVLRIKLLKTHTEDKQLILDEVQLEGKSPVSWKQLCQGYPEAKFE